MLSYQSTEHNTEIFVTDTAWLREGQIMLRSIFSIAQVIVKNREYELPIYIAFIDFGKSFDRMNKGRLWGIMAKKGTLKTSLELHKVFKWKSES